ncbi:MAG: tripartite tricarboxylate transporter TctB family protein [Rhizobiaceae bacterium]|nr:tripartite tricarboxylate transporter TctB family protein [Rhizobiaceae bacterium]
MSAADPSTAENELFLFAEQDPNSAEYWSDEHFGSAFKSECPPDKKVKVENLFSFKRQRGDLLFSGLLLVLAMFFLAFFWTETGWEKRKLPDEFGTYLLHQLGMIDVEGRVTRFGRILKQSWIAPMLCLLVFVPAAAWNMRNSVVAHHWRKRFHLPTKLNYELEQWARALEFVAYFIAYTLIVPILGYLVSTVLFGQFLTWRLGYRTKKWIGISLLSSTAIVLVFRTLLQIKTPVSIWLYDQLPVAIKSFMLSYF